LTGTVVIACRFPAHRKLLSHCVQIPSTPFVTSKVGEAGWKLSESSEACERPVMEATILRLQIRLIVSAVLFDFAMHRVRRVQSVGTSVAVLLLVASQRTSA